MMKLILKENVPNLGNIGETVTVKGGYGRNYLIPRGLAVAANTPNLQALEHDLNVQREQQQRLVDEASALAARLAAVSCSFTRKSGENDRLFGSVTSMDVAAALEAEGIPIDRRKIDLHEPIKSLGEFEVPVKLHTKVVATVKVLVSKEEEPQ